MSIRFVQKKNIFMKNKKGKKISGSCLVLLLFSVIKDPCYSISCDRSQGGRFHGRGRRERQTSIVIQSGPVYIYIYMVIYTHTAREYH